jgi:hypothetical protein
VIDVNDRRQLVAMYGAWKRVGTGGDAPQYITVAGNEDCLDIGHAHPSPAVESYPYQPSTSGNADCRVSTDARNDNGTFVATRASTRKRFGALMETTRTLTLDPREQNELFVTVGTATCLNVCGIAIPWGHAKSTTTRYTIVGEIDYSMPTR